LVAAELAAAELEATVLDAAELAAAVLDAAELAAAELEAAELDALLLPPQAVRPMHMAIMQASAIRTNLGFPITNSFNLKLPTKNDKSVVRLFAAKYKGIPERHHLSYPLVREQEVANRINSEVFLESARLLQKEIDRARDVRHDLRYLLHEIGALSDGQATPEIHRCIGRIEQLTRHADTVFCDNKALNALLIHGSASLSIEYGTNAIYNAN